MPSRARSVVVSAVVLALIVACAGQGSFTTAVPALPPAVPVHADAGSVRLVGYRAWGAVDGALSWAPTLCRRSAELRLSAAESGEGHGRKVYLLYARDRQAYLNGGQQPRSQILIKESWHPQASRGKPETGPRVNAGGQWYIPGRSNGLFVMSKGDPADPATDAGWTYATIAPDGSLSAQGKLASCMACHQHAPGDRLFGLPRR